MGKTLIRSILAGISISIGALIFLTLKQISLPFSAIFFTVGLLIILWYGFDLYTGKIGYLASTKDVPRMLLILAGNFIGCCIMFTFAGGPVGTTAAAIMAAKYELNLFEVLVRAIICGILIYVAVDQFKDKSNKSAPLIAIPAFILAGAEHCIADACYIFAGLAFSWHTIPFILTVIIGNAIGSIAFHQIKRRI